MKSNDKKLKDIKDELLKRRQEAFEESKSSGSRTRKIRGEEQQFSQSTLFDEIDRFSVVSEQIQTSRVVDFAIKDALETIQIVTSKLDDPDLSQQERKGLIEHLDVAEKQLDLGSEAGLDTDQVKEYRNTIAKVQDEINNFREITKEGTRSFDATRSFIAQQKDDALAGLVGVLTNNPALAIGFKMFSDFRKARQSSKDDADKRLSTSRRNQITSLEEQKTILKKSEEPIVEGKSSFDTRGLYDSVKSGIIDGLGTTSIEDESVDVFATDMTNTIVRAADEVQKDIESDPVLKERLETLPEDEVDDAFQQLIVDKVDELTIISKATLDVLADVKKESEDQTAIAEKAVLHAKENKLEADRKRRTPGKFVKDKLDDAKEGIVGMFGNISEIITAISVGLPLALGMLKAFGATLLKLLGPIAVIGTTIFAGFKAFEAWGDSEGKEITERISLTARSYGDAILGLFGTSGTEISTALLDTFQALADWWEDFSFIDMVKEMFGFGDSDKVKAQNKTADEAIKGSEASKQAFSTGTLGIGNDIHVEDEEQLKLVDSPSLRAIYKSDNATDETKTKILKELEERKEPLIIESPMQEQNNIPIIQPNVDRESTRLLEINNSAIESEKIERTNKDEGSISVVNNSNVNNSTVQSKSVPVTTPWSDTARDQRAYN